VGRYVSCGFPVVLVRRILSNWVRLDWTVRPRFSRTQVFADPGFRGPRFSRTQVFADPAIDEFGRRGHRRGFDCVHGGGPKQRSPDENATHETAFRLGPIRLQRLFLALGRIHLFVHTNPPIGFQ